MKLRGMLTAFVAIAMTGSASAQGPGTGYLPTVRHQQMLASTIPANGDQNPYAVVVAPVSAGTIQKGDVLVDNFNDSANLQGTGSTIVDYRPGTGQVGILARVPEDLQGCPGGVGLSGAMTMLKSGWVIVGSAPSKDGTTRTLGRGCLVVLDPTGKVTETLAGPEIDDPWSNMAVIDHGENAVLFFSNAGFGIGAPGQKVQTRATVLRVRLDITPGRPPAFAGMTVVGSGFAAQANAGAFLVGPTGLALGASGALFVSDAIGNRITEITDAVNRNDTGGIGVSVSAGNLLAQPLAMSVAPDGDLLVVNGLNGEIVEIEPATGHQVSSTWLNRDEAQNPPGSGDLFGIAMRPDGRGFYYVEDDVSSLMVQR